MKQRNKKQTEKKRQKEIEVVTKMIEIYCKKNTNVIQYVMNVKI